MLNHYEAVFILTPVLSEPQMKETVEKFKKLLTDNGAEIANEEQWGLKKLAYPIQKKSTGFYNLLQFDAEPSLIATLETSFRRDERVLRFLTMRLDKYAYEYAQKRLHGKKQQAEAPAEEIVAEPEIEVKPEENKED
ncbi:MAG: 30S ribosomal protein S6 [Paludibacteraceae bacterium]|jgi:small subunit ribosomal protein S6|nr:30S ribosomal protein S6 [Paludibacteraceae bacterium]